jgi:hypothetical protein
MSESIGSRLRPLAGSPWLHAVGLAVLSAAFESLFRRSGLNPLDEGWPLYAAMRLHEGGVLYRDVFFVFPPGHVLPAFLAYMWSPPGLVLARDLIAGFHVTLCVALYFLGRRLMPPAAALLGSAMVAVAAPFSHHSHYLFGFRYLVFTALALWCFSERLRTGDRRWMLAAGALVGAGMVFRWDPSLVAMVGIGAGVLVAERRFASWWADGLRFGLGLAAVAGPVVFWFAASVGFETLWREIVVRPVVMTDLQSLPVPKLRIPLVFDRRVIRDCFVTIQFRLYAVLYLVYAGLLLVRLARSLRSRQPFASPLLLAVVLWGGLFFLRSFGRSDEAHLDSTVPPSCLLLAHAIGSRLHGLRQRRGPRRQLAHVTLAASFGAWVFLTEADLSLDPSWRGTVPMLHGATHIRPHQRWRQFDQLVDGIQSLAPPGEVVLDLTASSLLLVVSERHGPGFYDVLMPGTFLTEEEERAFVASLERSPPALVIAERVPFDRSASRSLRAWAPLVHRWVAERYAFRERLGPFVLKTPVPGWPRRGGASTQPGSAGPMILAPGPKPGR